MCVDYWDLNKACPNNNYLTPFIDDCADSEIFLFMGGFYGYNQIDIHLEDQHKKTFICPWGTFMYQKFPSALKLLDPPSSRLCLMVSMTSRTS